MSIPSTQTKRTVATRGPNYPFIPLQTAIERARTLYNNEGRAAASPEVIVKHWGYKGTVSSAARQTLAALRAFGLLEATPSGSKLSDRALRILLDEREPSSERDQHIQSAALTPVIHRRLWERFGGELPSDANLRHTLLFEYQFNEAALDDFLKEYRGTLSYAKLDKPATMPLGGAASAETGEIGSGDGDERKDPPPPLPSPPFKGARPMETPAGFKQEVFSLPGGDAVLTYPAALDSVSASDLDDWLELVLKKIKRAAGAKTATPDPAEKPEE